MGFLMVVFAFMGAVVSLIGCGLSVWLTNLARKSTPFPRYIFPSIALALLVPLAIEAGNSSDINEWVMVGAYTSAAIIVFIYWIIAVITEILHK